MFRFKSSSSNIYKLAVKLASETDFNKKMEIIISAITQDQDLFEVCNEIEKLMLIANEKQLNILNIHYQHVIHKLAESRIEKSQSLFNQFDLTSLEDLNKLQSIIVETEILSNSKANKEESETTTYDDIPVNILGRNKVKLVKNIIKDLVDNKLNPYEKLFAEDFDCVTNLVRLDILNCQSTTQALLVLHRYITIMDRCFEANDLHSAFAIAVALDDEHIFKITGQSYVYLQEHMINKLNMVRQLNDPRRNNAAYRTFVEQLLKETYRSIIVPHVAKQTQPVAQLKQVADLMDDTGNVEKISFQNTLTNVVKTVSQMSNMKKGLKKAKEFDQNHWNNAQQKIKDRFKVAKYKDVEINDRTEWALIFCDLFNKTSWLKISEKSAKKNADHFRKLKLFYLHPMQHNKNPLIGKNKLHTAAKKHIDSNQRNYDEYNVQIQALRSKQPRTKKEDQLKTESKLKKIKKESKPKKEKQQKQKLIKAQSTTNEPSQPKITLERKPTQHIQYSSGSKLVKSPSPTIQAMLDVKVESPVKDFVTKTLERTASRRMATKTTSDLGASLSNYPSRSEFENDNASKINKQKQISEKQTVNQNDSMDSFGSYRNGTPISIAAKNDKIQIDDDEKSSSSLEIENIVDVVQSDDDNCNSRLPQPGIPLWKTKTASQRSDGFSTRPRSGSSRSRISYGSDQSNYYGSGEKGKLSSNENSFFSLKPVRSDSTGSEMVANEINFQAFAQSTTEQLLNGLYSDLESREAALAQKDLLESHRESLENEILELKTNIKKLTVTTDTKSPSPHSQS